MLGLGSLAVTGVIAVLRPVDVIWVVGVAVSALSLVAMLSPRLGASIRKLPSASGPPPRAVAPALILVATPCLIGLAGNDATPWALLVVGVTAPVVAFLYSRVIPGGLWCVRLVWPLLSVALSPLLGWTAGLMTVTIAVVVAVIAWHPTVKASYHPPREVGTVFPIPPELAPQEVLDAAEIDDTGRPL